MKRFLIALLFTFSVAFCVHADDLTVMRDIGGKPPKQMMSRYLKSLAYEAFQRRPEAYEALKTPEQVAAYQERMRGAFVEHLGGFPKRTPLNPKIVGTLRGEGYHIEKLIYESQPRHYVTALLYLPDTKPPFPAVLVPCGHSRDGKVSYQHVCILLAKYGIAALCYDPIGQGERYQLLDENGKPRFKSTTEHTLLGAACILLGRNTATYRIWDGVRSLDYLASREDIDATRIGVTGCSGGGTLTSYLMAIDQRVACAAPSCYITSFQRLMETIGPQDAEQNIHAQIAFGMDHADYLMMRAPKPTLLLASTHDFFDIDGTWDTFRQAKRIYTRLGFAERVALVETDAKHGYPRLQREAILRWMQRWLAGIDKTATEPEIKTRSERELLCTAPGQTMLMEGARSVMDLNVELNRGVDKQSRQLWKPGNRERALAEVRRIAGIRELDDLPKPRVTRLSTVERKGYRIEKLVLETEPGIQLPALIFKPAKPTGERSLYLHGEGKHVDAQPGGPIEDLVRSGHLVLAVDLRGTGETGPSSQSIWGGDSDDIFLAYLLGKSFVGMRADDVLVSARFLSGIEHGKTPGRVNVVAVGVAGPAALHAAAVEPQLFDTLKLKGALGSWSDVVRNPGAGGHLVNVVHGVLHAYDLPDLLRTLPPHKVSIKEPCDLSTGNVTGTGSGLNQQGSRPGPGELALSTAADPATDANGSEKKKEEWVQAMKRVHANFTGEPGTFAQFGDSITASRAFWFTVRHNRKNAPARMAEAFEVVNGYMLEDCWDRKGPEYGNQGQMTIRWARQNVDTWLKGLNPEVAILMFGTNDLNELDLQEYEGKTREVVRKCLDNGTIVILSTIPPRHGRAEKAAAFAEAVRRIARELKVPLSDYHAEILKRRPEDWDGGLEKFSQYQGYDVPTLISRDGVHPSNPEQYRGDYSEEGLKHNGYSLRNYLSLLKYAEVIERFLREK